jgi:hypothetical protein
MRRVRDGPVLDTGSGYKEPGAIKVTRHKSQSVSHLTRPTHLRVRISSNLFQHTRQLSLEQLKRVPRETFQDFRSASQADRSPRGAKYLQADMYFAQVGSHSSHASAG